jgi:hypothetical protein
MSATPNKGEHEYRDPSLGDPLEQSCMSPDPRPKRDWGFVASVILVVISILGLLYIMVWNR